MKDIMNKEENRALDPLFSVGAHIAYSKSRRHPSVKKYIFGRKEGLEIFDLEKTKTRLDEALAFVAQLSSRGKIILFVGTKPEAKRFVEAAAKRISMPYVTARWIGGALSNFEQIKRRLARFAELREAKEKPELLEKYTKRERLTIYRELEDLEKRFHGLENLAKLPDALFVVDSKKEATAVTEAQRLGIPVVALSNSDCDITGLTWPIIGNDASAKSIEFFVEAVTQAYLEGQRQKQEIAQAVLDTATRAATQTTAPKTE